MSCNKMEIVSDLDMLQHDINHFIYEVCPEAKQDRLPFPISKSISLYAFKLIHVYTWGPYHTKTHTVHRYFLTIVNDHTSATWTHIMVTEDEAVSLLKSFMART